MLRERELTCSIVSYRTQGADEEEGRGGNVPKRESEGLANQQSIRVSKENRCPVGGGNGSMGDEHAEREKLVGVKRS